MDLLVRRIGRLHTMSDGLVEQAAVLVRNGLVHWVGHDSDLSPGLGDVPEWDAEGRTAVPGFVDAHTHLVWAGTRREEFVARLAGQPYDGGGIRTTVAATRAASTETLVELARTRAHAALAAGTTTMEIKTGYGLSPQEELRQLEVTRRLDKELPLRIESTFLGAHVVPEGADQSAYVEEVIDTLPAAAHGGARWCDVFCDAGVFTVDEARRILTAARHHGLGLRIHAEEIAHTGAAGLAAELQCASADHLEHVTLPDAHAMAAAGVVGVLLPTVTLSLRTFEFGQLTRLNEAGVEIALATDCNPGSSWCESMPYAVQLACLVYGMPVDVALRSATLGGARALRRDDVGHLSVGARGDLAILNTDHEADLVAHLGAAGVAGTIIDGNVWSDPSSS